MGRIYRSWLRESGCRWHDCAAVRAGGQAYIPKSRAHSNSRWEHNASAARCTMRRGNCHTAQGFLRLGHLTALRGVRWTKASLHYGACTAWALSACCCDRVSLTDLHEPILTITGTVSTYLPWPATTTVSRLRRAIHV